ncbi:MAG: flavodoxin family protein [Haliea sp.]|jgi:putative NADPH-quinone reductase|nr:flavodoxin family protein [Haliea sp.]
MPRKILVLFAHPSLHRSEVNRQMLRQVDGLPGVTLVDLYGEYPTLQIDIDREQGRLVEHDVIVFMFPMYWYSTPAILKEWQDLVLEYGFAYGDHGTALRGKLFLCALTAGGSEEGYTAYGYNHYTLPELLQPLEQTAALCGMRYLPPFALFGARTALEEGRVDRHAADWRRVLEALRDDTLDLAKVESLPRLNDNLDALLEESA